MEIANTLSGKTFQSSNTGSKWPFYLVMAYIFFEFGRPQDIIVGIQYFSFPAIITILIGISILIKGLVNIKGKQTTIIIFLILLMFYHVPMAVNNFWAFHIAWGMLISFVAYLGIVTFVDSIEKFNKLIMFWIAINVFNAAYGIMHSGRGIGGYFEDENDFCMAMNMVLPFSYFFIFNIQNIYNKIVYATITGIFLLSIAFTMSRGGFIGLVSVITYSWLKTSKKILSIAIIGVLSLFVMQFTPPKYIERIKSIQNSSDSGSGEERLYTWKLGWEMFKGNWVLGVGQGNFPYRFREYEVASGNADGLHGKSIAGRAAHSLYITVISELGIVGCILISLFIYNFFYGNKIIRNKYIQKLKGIYKLNDTTRYYNISYALDSSLIGYLVSGIFISVLYFPNMWILAGFFESFRRIMVSEEDANNPTHD